MNPEIKRCLQEAVNYAYGESAHARGASAGYFFRVLEMAEAEYERGQLDYLDRFRITSQVLVNAGFDPTPEMVHFSEADRPVPGKE